jgi:hypothetical protein
MRTFDATKPKFPVMFRAACILTNFIHRRRKNMEVDANGVVDQPDVDAEFDPRGWDGDY